jgi:hypothetical protein
MKPTANYKMSKSLKASLALSSYQDPHKKGQWKRAMIDAELSAAVQIRPSKDRNHQSNP